MPHRIIVKDSDKKGGRRRKRVLKGGEGEGLSRTAPQGNLGVTPLKSYPLNGSTKRDSAMNTQNDMNATQQGMIDKHGGRRRKKNTIRRRTSKKVLRKRRKTKRLRRRSERCRRRCRTQCKRRCLRARCQNTRKSKRKGRRNRKLKRGGANTDGPNCAVPTEPVTVVSFSNPSPVSPVDSTSASKGGNSTNMQAGADACNDHYATSGGRRRTRRMKGGRKEGFQNWHDVFGGFGDKMTGGKSRKKKAGTSKRVWKSCMSGGKVRPLSSAPVRNINPAEDLGNDGTWEKQEYD